jgi:hypothetical protein
MLPKRLYSITKPIQLKKTNAINHFDLNIAIIGVTLSA